MSTVERIADALKRQGRFAEKRHESREAREEVAEHETWIWHRGAYDPDGRGHSYCYFDRTGLSIRDPSGDLELDRRDRRFVGRGDPRPDRGR